MTRSTCPQCHRTLTLRRDGTLPMHSPEPQGPGRVAEPFCPGGGVPHIHQCGCGVRWDEHAGVNA